MLDIKLSVDGSEISETAAPYVIAEAGSNFNQSMDTAKRLTEVAAKAGANAVKFQLFRAKSLYPEGHPAHAQVAAVELNPDWIPALMACAADNGITWLASAFDFASLEALEANGVAAHKVASSEATNIPLLARMAETGKPIFLSTGMCDLADVNDAVDVCARRNNTNIAVLQCTALYPTEPADVNLKVLETYRIAFGGVVGFSDHTLRHAAAITAVGLGARVFEKHFTLDRSAEGPDHFYALEPDGLQGYIADLHEAFESLGTGAKRFLDAEAEYGRRDGLYAARALAAGTMLTEGDLAIRRPATGIAARHRATVVGARVTHPVADGTALSWDDIEF